MIYEVYSDNELSKQIRLLKKTETNFHVLFTNPTDPKSTYLLERINYVNDTPVDIIVVDSFLCPSGFTLGSFHVTKTPTLVTFQFNPVFGYSVTQHEWVSVMEEILELV